MKIYENVEAVPSRMTGLIRLLLDVGRRGLDEGAVRELLQPPSLREPGSPPATFAPRTIDAALETGLIVRAKENQQFVLSLAPDAFEALARANRVADVIRELLTQRLLAPEAGGERNRFAILCAWFLTRPVTWLPQEHVDIQRAMKDDGLDLAELRVTSENNIDNVLYWARHLGLLWWAKEKMACMVVPDPAAFLVRHLDRLLQPGERMDASAFRANLGDLCPVLDGGVVRKDVLQKVSAAQLRQIEEDCLSEGLSLALRQLAESGILHYDCPNDARHFLRLYDQQRVAFIERPKAHSRIADAMEAFL
jgi:hypothetical protein